MTEANEVLRTIVKEIYIRRLISSQSLTEEEGMKVLLRIHEEVLVDQEGKPGAA